jgi:hypothetical protein
MEAGREADLPSPIARGGTIEPRVLIQKVYRDLIRANNHCKTRDLYMEEVGGWMFIVFDEGRHLWKDV